MKTIGRAFYYVGLVLLWALVLGGVLEVWERWRWHRIEDQNPYVLFRTEGLSWPVSSDLSDHFSPFLTDPEMRARYRGRGKSMQPQPQPDPLAATERRILFHAELDAEKRRLFSELHGWNSVAVIPVSDARIEGGQGDWPGHFPEEDVSALIAATDRMDRENTPMARVRAASPGTLYYLLSPGTVSPEHGYRLFYREGAPTPPPSVDNLWDIPYFIYRKHVALAGHTAIPGSIARKFYINNYGFRDADLIVPKPEGVFRILCIGASTTEEGPDNDLTYPAILETVLNRHFNTNCIDVVNCGVSGMDSAKHVLRLPDYLALEPDLIVIYNAVNDICHGLIPGWVQNPALPERLLRKSFLIRRYAGALILPPAGYVYQEIMDTRMENLRFIVRKAAERGVASAVCSFAAPDPECLSREERDYYDFFTVREWGGRYVSFGSYRRVLGLYNKALHQLAREEALLYVPVAEKLRADAAFFGDICHLRNPGIEHKAEVIAESLIPYLESRLSPACVSFQGN